MKLNVYSLFDSKAKAYGSPFYQTQHGLAIRMVTTLANDKGSEVNHYPGDFTLYCIGAFDSSTGEFTNVTPPENLGLVTNYIEVVKA